MPIMCYICGREFGTRSIKIHIPQCVKKWDIEQLKLPKNQRRSPPCAPQNFDRVVSGEIKDTKLIQEYNNVAFADWNQKALVECQNCSRTFLPKSLEIHSRSCKVRPEPPSSDKRAVTVTLTTSRIARKPSIKKPVRPGTYTKSTNNNVNNNNNNNNKKEVSKDDIINVIRKDVVFNNPEKRKDLMEYIQKLCLN